MKVAHQRVHTQGTAYLHTACPYLIHPTVRLNSSSAASLTAWSASGG